MNEEDNIEKEAEEANNVQLEEVAAKVMTEESAIEIEINAENSAENVVAQVDEAKPSKQLIIELDTKRDQVFGNSLPSPIVSGYILIPIILL